MARISIDKQITYYRRQNGITQSKLAETLGVTNQAVSKWESGSCCPDIAILPDIAAFFGVTVDELLGYSSDDLIMVKTSEQLLDMCVYARENGLYPLLDYVNAIEGFPFIKIAAELVILHSFSYDSARALLNSVMDDKKQSALIGDCIIVIAQGSSPEALLCIFKNRLTAEEFALLKTDRPDFFEYTDIRKD